MIYLVELKKKSLTRVLVTLITAVVIAVNIKVDKMRPGVRIFNNSSVSACVFSRGGRHENAI